MKYFQRFLFLAFLFCYITNTFAQEKVSYTLTVSSQEAAKPYDFFGVISKPLRFNWTLEQDPYSFDSSIEGRLMIRVSKDSLLSSDDVMVLDSVCTLPPFSYNEKSVKHVLPTGEHYLFTTFYAKDQNKYKAESNTARTFIQLYEVKLSATEGWLSYIKTSENSEDIQLHLEINNHVTCCTNLLGGLSSQWEVGLGKKEGVITTSLATFYRNDSLSAGSNKFVMDESLFEKPAFEKNNFLVIKVTSTYFSQGYRTIPDFTVTLPLKVITDVEELIKLKRKQYPFLTYGKFIITEKELANARFDTLYKQAEHFYQLVGKSLEAAHLRKAKEALQWADAAFSFTGNHRLSSMIYSPPDAVANLYAGLSKLMDVNQLFTNDKEKEALSFRLGEAMKMEDMMEEGYSSLIKLILPDTLSILNEVEKSGYFENQNKFRQTNITDLPVLWRERSLPAFEHFMRTRDLETADVIATQVGEHIKLALPLWEMISSDTSLTKHYRYLANSLTETNEMLDFELARLQYLAELGFYEEAEQVIKETTLAYACSYQFQPEKFWLSAGQFYEAAGDFTKADSLYGLTDHFVKNEIEKQSADKTSKARWQLKSHNQELLTAKQSTPSLNSTISKQLTADLKTINENSFFSYLDLIADRNLAQKLGFFNSPLYPNFYLKQIKSLEAQGENFLANDWMKELAFFLGRDKKYNESIFLYENLFLISNLQSTALRLGFSEEVQIFLSQKQQETLSRFINIIEASKSIISAERYDSLLHTVLDQALFQHAFILRGNYQLVYDAQRSKDEAVQKQYILWQTLREYLNELYVKGEADKESANILRSEILRSESKLARLARDTMSMRLDYIPPIDSIRKHLKENEAAIEIIRYQVNHEIYYGQKVKYAALVVKKTGPLVMIHFPTNGELMEGRHYKLYRNSIQQKIEDETSYRIYWEPVKGALKEVKKVYWAPDGVYHLINPNTLYNPDTKKYLLDEIQLQVVPTIAQLSDEKPLLISSAAILGDPIYSEVKSTKKSDSTRNSSGFLTRQAIAQLPGTKVEAETIASLLRHSKAQVTLLTEGKANKQEIFKIKPSDVLHLATHGFWIDNPPTAGFHNVFETLAHSGLILSGAQKSDGAGGFQLMPHGIITSAEIQELNLFNTQLVVLSACETGLGEVIPGEGLYGLKRALQKAGARNLITSLWKVDDEATQLFMTQFYTQLIETKNLSHSFHQAMTFLQKKFPEPYYWGAFVLTSH